MKCFLHPNADAVGVCVKCGKAICPSCCHEKPDKHLACSTCSEKELSLKNVLPKIFRGHLKIINAGFIVILLIIAVFLDILNIAHSSVFGIYLTDLSISGLEMLFLYLLGVPPIKSILIGLVDMVPIIEYIPWCTMAVLDKKIGLKIPGLTFVFHHMK